jgi:hypothetical protein
VISNVMSSGRASARRSADSTASRNELWLIDAADTLTSTARPLAANPAA